MRFIYTGYFRFPNGDAAASRVLNNARILRDLGHDVFVVSFGGTPRTGDLTESGYEYDGIKYINTNDIDTHTIKERLLRYVAPAPKAMKIIREQIGKIDGIISYNPTAALNIRLKKLCNRNSIHYIVDLTEWPAPNEMPGGKYFPIYWQSEYNFKRIQKSISNFIPISTYLRDYYQQSNHVLLPPLIDVNDKKWSVFQYITDSRIADFKGIRIVFAGTPAKKDLLGNLINSLCAILPEHQNFQLVVAGVDSDSGKAFFDNPTDFDCFADNFVFLGRIPQEMVPSIYHISDFSAIIREPSRKNTAGFPTKMAESMVSGCPILLNYTSDLAQYAIDGQNAVVIPDYTIESIKDGLKRISQFSDEDIKRMKTNTLNIGKSVFDYRNYIDKTERFISSLR